MAKTTKKSSPAASASKLRKAKRKKPQTAGGFDVPFDPVAQLKAHGALGPKKPLAAAAAPRATADVLDRLWNVIESRKDADPNVSHSARLLAKGAPRIVQKLGEEAVECLIEIMQGNRVGTITESADLIYHLLVSWVHAGIRPEEVWHELQNRENASYSTEGTRGAVKRLLGSVNIGTTKIP
jgi:phosphoribosyl-ATP pyrophosphohydrolase